MTAREAGSVKKSAGFYNRILTGTAAVTFPAAALSATQEPVFEVLVQNSPASANPVFIGNETQGQFVEIVAGQSICIPAANLNLIYVRTNGGAATVNWMAMA